MKGRRLIVLLVLGSASVLLLPYYLHTTDIFEGSGDHKAEVLLVLLAPIRS